ncbi:MAG: hypothetical protein P8181_08600 [bacterium]
MSRFLERHPSSIAQSAVEFLRDANVSESTRRLYEDVLELFVAYLMNDGTAVEPSPHGDYVLVAGWGTYWGGAFDNFLDLFLPAQPVGPTFIKRAPAVLRKWAKWSFDQGYLDDLRYEDFLEAVPPSKAADMLRLRRAGDLLFDLHSPPFEEMMGDNVARLVQDHDMHEPEVVEEGYVMVIRFDGEAGYVKTEDGRVVGPVFFGRVLIDTLRIGDVLNVVIGRFGKRWHVLESGDVYPESQWFGE